MREIPLFCPKTPVSSYTGTSELGLLSIPQIMLIFFLQGSVPSSDFLPPSFPFFVPFLPLPPSSVLLSLLPSFFLLLVYV